MKDDCRRRGEILAPVLALIFTQTQAFHGYCSQKLSHQIKIPQGLDKLQMIYESP
jgi:hypothetical protein